MDLQSKMYDETKGERKKLTNCTLTDLFDEVFKIWDILSPSFFCLYTPHAASRAMIYCSRAMIY